MDIILYVVIGLVALIVIFALSSVGIYNSLVVLRNRVMDQWAQIDVQLKRRVDLVPNLVETVKGYASHEKETFEAVVNARSQFMSATSPEAEMAASGELTKVLGRLFALSEAYPELKANENFLQLLATLKEIDEKIAVARQFYNDSVLTYKNKLEVFPSNIIAGMFKFEPKPFFEADESEKAVPKVSF